MSVNLCAIPYSRYVSGQANLAVSAEPGQGDYVELVLVRRGMARSRSSSFPGVAAVSAATSDAPWTVVAEAEMADRQPQNQSTGSCLLSEPAILEA